MTALDRGYGSGMTEESKPRAAAEGTPDEQAAGDTDCSRCGGSGLLDEDDCPTCKGTGRVTKS